MINEITETTESTWQFVCSWDISRYDGLSLECVGCFRVSAIIGGRRENNFQLKIAFSKYTNKNELIEYVAWEYRILI